MIDEARLLSDGAKRTLENKLANLEAHAAKQLIVVTLASARGMTVDDYGLALRKQWGLEANGKRVMLIVGSTEGRSVIQYDNSLKGYLGERRHRAHSRTDDEAALQRRRFSRRRGGRRERADRRADQGAIRRPRPRPCASRKPTRSGCRRRAEYPALSGRVVDDAGVLDAATRESLRAKLAAFEAKTTHQLVVATVKSLNGNSVEEYANRLFRRWQLGQRGKNNGVLLLHAPTERKIRIEVGYGLEGTLTDAITKYIIANAITPRFKANDFSGGMTRGVDDIIKVLDGGAEEFKQRAAPKGWRLPPDAIFMAMLRALHHRNLDGRPDRPDPCAVRLARLGAEEAEVGLLALDGQFLVLIVGKLVRLVVVVIGLVVELVRRLERQFLRRRRRFRRRRFLGRLLRGSR